MITSAVSNKLTVHYRKEMNDLLRERVKTGALGEKIAEEYLFLDGTFAYYQEYHQGIFTDKTFFIFSGDEPVLVMWCLAHQQKLGYFHLPARILMCDIEPDTRNKAARLMLQELEAIMLAEKITEFSFSYNEYLAGAYFHMANVRTVHTAVVDLLMEEEQIRSNIRKSYKSLINWGQREMRTLVMDSSNADHDLFFSIRDFHIAVAGRKTRSDVSWQKQFDSVAAGEAYVVYSTINGKLASAALILHGTEEAFYGVGINDRELMKLHPVSHYPLYHAILHAKRIGLQRFNMNEVDAGGHEKQDNIAAFKKGFTKTLSAHAVYTVQLNGKHLQA